MVVFGGAEVWWGMCFFQLLHAQRGTELCCWVPAGVPLLLPSPMVRFPLVALPPWAVHGGADSGLPETLLPPQALSPRTQRTSRHHFTQVSLN